MKLVIAVVQDQTKQKLLDELVSNRISLTELPSIGGIFGEASATLLICVPDEEVDKLLGVIEAAGRASDKFLNVGVEPAHVSTPFLSLFGTQPVQSHEGGTVAFVMPVESFHKF